MEVWEHFRGIIFQLWPNFTVANQEDGCSWRERQLDKKTYLCLWFYCQIILISTLDNTTFIIGIWWILIENNQNMDFPIYHFFRHDSIFIKFCWCAKFPSKLLHYCFSNNFDLDFRLIILDPTHAQHNYNKISTKFQLKTIPPNTQVFTSHYTTPYIHGLFFLVWCNLH